MPIPEPETHPWYIAETKTKTVKTPYKHHDRRCSLSGLSDIVVLQQDFQLLELIFAFDLHLHGHIHTVLLGDQ